jgi:hypothetical protein
MNIPREHAKEFVGPGWSSLIDEIYDRIEKFPDVYIAQIKEKFGTLRFYVDGCDDTTFDFIESVCEKSATICEQCGKPGLLREGGWILTLCDEHAEGRKPL